jgi:hypothetical protein
LTITDETGGVPTVVFSAVIPPGGSCGGNPCWKKIGHNTLKGFKYRDRDGTNDGILKISLKIKRGNRAKVAVIGKGVNLPVPSLPLSQDPRIRVRLSNSIGNVFEVPYFPPALRNDSKTFRDRQGP